MKKTVETCSICWIEEKCFQSFGRKSERKKNKEHLGLNERIILTWISKE
jgi:hypothetical protein